MTEEWLDHVELPDGQAVDLLKRYPAERAAQIELARERDITVMQALLIDAKSKAQVGRTTATGFANALLTASLWTSTTAQCARPHRLIHALTGDVIDVSQIGMARDEIAKILRERAAENYVAWYEEAYPGPKDSPETDSQTPASETPVNSDPMTPAPIPSETSA